MSEGILIFATNSVTSDGRTLDYVGLSQHSARLAKKHLNLPVALATADDVDSDCFDRIIRITRKQANSRTIINGNEPLTYEWHNVDRLDALDLTPWDRTLVIDADYLVLSDQLRSIIESDLPFLIAEEVFDITGNNDFRTSRLLPDRTIAQKWATVMCFDRTQDAVFRAARMVRNNYEYYATMFGWKKNPYRNDHAFTVAAHLLGIVSLPFPMFQLPAFAEIASADAKGLRILYGNKIMRWNHDVHVLNKSVALNPDVLEGLHV